MTMKVSKEGRELIEAFEGCEKPIHGRPGFFTTYRDEVGVLTIGYGHTNLGNIPPHIHPGMVMSQAECDAALSIDLRVFEQSTDKFLKGLVVSQHQFDALVSFDFNTGDLHKSSIGTKLRAGQTAEAMATLLQYTHAGGQQLAGLVRRRRAEKLLFQGHVAEALALAGVHAVSGDTMARAALSAHSAD